MTKPPHGPEDQRATTAREAPPGKRAWTDARSGAGYFVAAYNTNPAMFISGGRRKPPLRKEENRISFEPAGSGVALTADTGQDILDVFGLTDEDLQRWLDRARD